MRYRYRFDRFTWCFGGGSMNWALIHAWAEEIGLWSTLIVNATLIAGAVPTGIALSRKLPMTRVLRIAAIGVVVGSVLSTVAACAWLTLAPEPVIVQTERVDVKAFLDWSAAVKKICNDPNKKSLPGCIEEAKPSSK